MLAKTEKLMATVTWSQGSADVSLSVEATDAKSVELEGTSGNQVAQTLAIVASCLGSANSDRRVVELPLFAPVVPPLAWNLAASGSLRIDLKKETPGQWPRLTSLQKDPAHVKVNWARYSGDGSDAEDEDGDHDSYLRSRYGVTSNWKGPASGDQPPVLGGRTPGKAMEDHENPSVDILGGNEAEALQSEVNTSHKEGNPPASSSWLIAGLRTTQLFAWFMPASYLLDTTLQLSPQPPALQTGLYLMPCLLALSLGSLDLMLAMGTSIIEGPRLAVFACWLKRSFIAMSFLTYEARFGQAMSLFAAGPLSALAMTIAWTTSKLHLYWADATDALPLALRGIFFGGGTSAERSQYRLFLFLFEATMEFAFLLCHSVRLPPGARPLLTVLAGPRAAWALACSAVLLADLMAFNALRSSRHGAMVGATIASAVQQAAEKAKVA